MIFVKYIFFIAFVFSLVFSQTGPVMFIEGGADVNTGNHRRGNEVVYEIKFKNTGDSDLKITSVSTSCGCSSALTSSDNIAPGSEGTIKFTFNGQGFGKVTKAVYIVTNETANPNHSINLSMIMIDPVTLNPQSIISEGKVGDELKKTATIFNSDTKDIEITEISSNTPVIKITSDKMHLASGEAASLDILIKIYEESAINAAIIIKTSEGEFQIPVLVDVKAN
ncbi:MAG TPA: DUF1573 domain-containing protein [Ignavibacteria bacterium]|nr:DUF1573 domain-containing protein [Ignavibacteria bacterium]